YWVLQRLPAVTAGVSSLAIPVVSILTSYLFLGEHPVALQWAGIVAILIALAVVTYPDGSANAQKGKAPELSGFNRRLNS
ncbi:MAG: EamA family transporter, partial [Vulcanimicrobiaceae bacterium]